MDIIGYRLKNGKSQFGCPGRNSTTVSIGNFSYAHETECFEEFDGSNKEKSEEFTDSIDFGISAGQTYIPIVGYHWNVSLSLSGMIKDIF